MRMNGAQIIWECLVREGVDVAFGITGGKVIHHITMRHEQAAAHAADGYARAHPGPARPTASPESLRPTWIRCPW